MVTSRLNRMIILSLPRLHIGKKSQGCKAYLTLLIRQGKTNHWRFIKTEENFITYPPTESLNNKTERVNSFTVKYSGTGLTSSAKHPQVGDHTRLPSYRPDEQMEQHIIRVLTKGSEIAVSDGSFK